MNYPGKKGRSRMSKVAVIYWSGTGNTEAMANAVKAGAEQAGAEVAICTPKTFSGSVAAFDAVAFGCPAMGAEVLEEDLFDPMWQDLKAELNGKNIALFGSYGWGDGEWMRSWEDEARAAGANLVTASVMANEMPADTDLAACRALGAALA